MDRILRRGVRGWSSPTFRRFCSSTVSVNPGEIGEVSGIPEKHLKREVIIYSPARTASQQGSANTGKWKIRFISTEKWENPLMGWTSTGDPYANLGEHTLNFDSITAAVDFAVRHGWEYSVREPHRPIIKPKSYADNFKYKGPPNTDGN